MASFSFNGTTITRPAILVRSVIGAQKVLSLLPFGTLCYVGPADGGKGAGTVYRFDDLNAAKRVLRGGKVLDAITKGNVGGASGFIVATTGTKAYATAAIGGGDAILSAGDPGAWGDAITFASVAGSSTGDAVTITFPDAITGQTVTVGGLGTAYDNLADLNALAAVIAKDALLTPPASTGLPPIVTLTVNTNAPIGVQSTISLSGGTGTGQDVPSYADAKAALDNLDDVAFDIGRLVGIYDSQSQAYANGKAQSHEVYGILRRFIHQITPSGVSASASKAANSSAVVNSAISAAQAMNYYRASVCAQKIRVLNRATGTYDYVDAADLAAGMAVAVGASDQWGPSSPLTHVPIPGAADVDYPILATNGDQDRAIKAGVMLFETVGQAQPGAVRCVQSVTTQPNDPSTGEPWIFGEFSGVRGADALLANVKAAIEESKPRAIGGGNTLGTMNAMLAKVVNVLELAYDNGWTVGYDPKSIHVETSGATGSDDLLYYAAQITPPLNHLGITQTLLPYTASVSLGGSVTG